ncbi:enoyl-CoA hydratase/isomerase family protein [Aneurinibacillus tyrosinisolvens]|uniref:enoyl-CoA hydratase/isomerase family protein n=1 Tax=Aneurinibacillus tyrosinisolvens TaxID=1443435 RepID=UPI001F3ADFF1|nr:enoyl-CoA hydratase [Aneurinibacillus tyrosinisolvens]
MANVEYVLFSRKKRKFLLEERMNPLMNERNTNEHLLIEVEDHVLFITLNRPDVLNAYSEEMIRGLLAAFDRAAGDEAIRAVVLTGAGRSFCAGGDVKSMSELSPLQVNGFVALLNDLVQKISELEKPVIAAVNGYAVGAGVCLALACDLVIAAEDSKFAVSFAQVGLIADGGGMFFLPRTLGTHRAKELLFTGKTISVEKAQDWGMVNEIYPADALREEVAKLARQLAHGPARAYAMIKKIANQSLTADLADILEMERATQTVMAMTDDHKEGVTAFKEKRVPRFTGK